MEGDQIRRTRQGEKGITEDEMVGWHHRLNRREFEQTQGDSEGQGSLACCSPWGCKELDMAEVTEHMFRVKRKSYLIFKT